MRLGEALRVDADNSVWVISGPISGIDNTYPHLPACTAGSVWPRLRHQREGGLFIFGATARDGGWYRSAQYAGRVLGIAAPGAAS